MCWRIWYADGSIFDSEDGTPDEAPCGGVQVIGEYQDNRRRLHEGGDFYVFDGEWWGMSRQATAGCKIGTAIETELFKQMREEALRWLYAR